jgi:hypothetical protein
MKKAIIFGMLLALVITGCTKSDDTGPETDPQKIGIVGEWYSKGTDVAPLLVTLMKTDSINVKFESNNTYVVTHFDNTKTKTIMTGTYTQQKSGTGTIWKITLNQTSPTALTSEGIFDISTTTTPYSMQYEVVQTQPAIGATPPTATAGFGSTNGGALGVLNVQKYKKIVK